MRQKIHRQAQRLLPNRKLVRRRKEGVRIPSFPPSTANHEPLKIGASLQPRCPAVPINSRGRTVGE